MQLAEHLPAVLYRTRGGALSALALATLAEPMPPHLGAGIDTGHPARYVEITADTTADSSHERIVILVKNSEAAEAAITVLVDD